MKLKEAEKLILSQGFTRIIPKENKKDVEKFLIEEMSFKKKFVEDRSTYWLESKFDVYSLFEIIIAYDSGDLFFEIYTVDDYGKKTKTSETIKMIKNPSLEKVKTIINNLNNSSTK